MVGSRIDITVLNGGEKRYRNKSESEYGIGVQTE